MAYFQKDFLDFFIELAPNNNKDWFDINRKRYEQNVKKAFADFVQAGIDKLAFTEPAYKEITPSESIFRINRDIRFAKDKAPYKLFCSAVFSPHGKKSTSIHGIYFECGPEAIRVYGGIYEISKEDLLSVREGISAHAEEFQRLISDKEFTSLFGELNGEKNKIIPKELKEAAEKQPLIFNKQFYFMTEFPAEIILQDDFLDILLNCYRVGAPLERFFNQFIQRN